MPSTTLLPPVPSDLLGAQRPRVSSVPTYASSTGPEAIELAHIAGLDLDEWQQYVLTASLGERPDGRWAAFEVGAVVSRQNGKGGLLEARELAGLFLLDERLLIHSAHLFDTSMEAFGRLVPLIQDTPSLSKRVRRIVNSHGQEGIELKNGHRIRFRTRTKGGGRGFTADCLILDEAMEIPTSTHSALLPTLSARPNPQVWYTGSAVDQEIHDNGVVLARIRERGHRGGDSSLAYFEWSAPLELHKITPEDAADPAHWVVANPALGIRISSEHVGYERAGMGTREFAVERLGVGDWPRTDDAAAKVIAPEAWKACLDPESTIFGPVSLAFDVSPNRSRAAICAAGRTEDGRIHVEVIEHDSGTGWVATRMAEIQARNASLVVVCEPAGPAGSLIPAMEEAGVKVKVVDARETAQACGQFYDAVIDGQLRHLGTPELTAAVDGAARRNLGDAWAWSRKSSSVDICPLVGCTLALWGFLQMAHDDPQVLSLEDFLDDDDDWDDDELDEPAEDEDEEA